MTVLLAGSFALGAGVLAGNGHCSSIGMALIGGGSLSALLAVSWVNRNY
jgi:hypothetical protein